MTVAWLQLRNPFTGKWTGVVPGVGPEGPAGPAGADGADGADGQGVPVGGNAAQILSKIDGTDFNTEWVDPPTGAGTPSGTVVNETAYGAAPAAGASTDYSRGDHTHGSVPLPKLNEVANPDANKSFQCAAKSIQFSFTNPSNAPTYDGAFEIEATGAFTGDLLHIHQHTGNPGVSDLVHLEAEDADVLPLRVNAAGTVAIETNKQVKSTLATGTAPLIVASTTKVTNLNADLLDGQEATAFLPANGVTYEALDANGDVGTGAGQVAIGNHTHPGGSEAFPVGSVFIAVVNTNPGTLLGYGTWAAFGAGKVMVGLDSGDTDFDTAEETGGAKTRTPSAHAGAAVADHASHTHTYTQVPNHVHVQTLPSTQAGNFACGTRDTSSGGTGGSPGTVADTLSTANPTGGVATGTTAGPSATLSHSVTQPSDHSAISVVQPYIVCYFWKRTA